SRVVIICNDWKTLNRNVAALQDRGHVLFFEPTPLEVHRKAVPWFKDEDIYIWFEANLHRIREPSLRLYVRARELKRAGLMWKEVLESEPENPRGKLAAQILENEVYMRTKERVQAFVSQGGGCRATFFNYKRLLKEGVAK